MSPHPDRRLFLAPDTAVEPPDLRTLRERFSELDPDGVPAQVHRLGELLESLAARAAMDGASRETLYRALALCRGLEDEVRVTGDALAALNAGPHGGQGWSPAGDPASGF